MKLNLTALVYGEVQRLRFIQRFSTCPVVHEESVAEHSFFVVFASLLIGDWLRSRGNNAINFEILAKKAAFHDVEEARTGDIFRPFKYSTPELHDALERGAERAAYDALAGLADGDAASLEGMLSHWKRAKDTTIEGRIVAFADFLSVLSYMVQETHASNSFMREHRETMRAYLAEFQHHSFAPLQPLIDEAAKIIEEVLV